MFIKCKLTDMPCLYSIRWPETEWINHIKLKQNKKSGSNSRQYKYKLWIHNEVKMCFGVRFFRILSCFYFVEPFFLLHVWHHNHYSRYIGNFKITLWHILYISNSAVYFDWKTVFYFYFLVYFFMSSSYLSHTLFSSENS